ncbi:MAG: PFL family protein [Candidatus Muirbacterium halophilum]|nr:PFL family protein [Candidatus Muirbacterium halophilum]
MFLTAEEILQTISMVSVENFDVRTTTLGISLRDCRGVDADATAKKIYDKICFRAEKLISCANIIEAKYGLPIVNKRASVTPIAVIGDGFDKDGMIKLAIAMDKAAETVGINYIGGFSALVQKGATVGDLALIEAIPEALNITQRVCSSVNVASTKAGINLDMIYKMAKQIKKTAELTADRGSIGCAKLVVFANAVEDNPFIAGAFHGISEPEVVLNVGISGPGVVRHVLEKNGKGLNIGDLAELIKKTAFKITRMGQLVGQEVSELMGVPFGIVDISLAPTPAIGDSVANILELMGLEMCGTDGTTFALAILNDAVKKGGVMATQRVGGLSGAFIPVSEDEGMIKAVECGALSLERLQCMTCVCSVGLDMIAIPGDTSVETIAGIIADEMAIGVINTKTTAARLIPVIGKGVGEKVCYGGLLGDAPIMAVGKYSCAEIIKRGGRVPAPINSLKN